MYLLSRLCKKEIVPYKICKLENVPVWEGISPPTLQLHKELYTKIELHKIFLKHITNKGYFSHLTKRCKN